MKSFDQLAQVAYAAYTKQAVGKAFDGKPLPTYAQLGAERQACWVAVAKQLVAEVAALH
jgi:transcriptional regulator of met regulon